MSSVAATADHYQVLIGGGGTAGLSVAARLRRAGELGRMFYDSGQRKLMSLPDKVRVFPAHGRARPAGRTCPPSGSPRSAGSGRPTTPARR